ncbi:hypothetical protein VKT23_019136 [Stygiomarasmius scandens]|uniref:Uncharacterized protein n=1 Tax=Marasmiellus scandens TaxID=2682957 RepID=A0ABR1IR56_9AGAR
MAPRVNHDQPLSESQHISPTTQGTIYPSTLNPTDGGANVRGRWHLMMLPSRIRNSSGFAAAQWRENIGEMQVQLGHNAREYGPEPEDMKGEEEFISLPPSYTSVSR